MNVSWSPSAIVPGRLPITGYRASAYTSLSDSTANGQCTTSSPEELSCVIEGLTPGDTYWFAVAARSGTFTGTSSQRVEFEVPNQGAYAAVTTGAFHTCALDGDGNAWCWGDNSLGQLGDGSEDNTASIPMAVVTPQAFPSGGYVSIDAGGDATCAIDTAADIWCWGSNGQGQLGVGDWNVGNANIPRKIVMPVVNDVTVNFVQVSVGDQHVCARTSGGVLYCWGDNASGQLGNLQYDSSENAPVLVTTISMLPQTYQWVSAGASHTCAIASASPANNPLNNTAWCWGDGNGGALGYSGADGFYTEPVAVTTGTGLPSTYASISAGFEYTCAVATNGGAWCWGDESNGELGNDSDAGDYLDTPQPVDTAGTRPDTYSLVVVDGYHTCALTGSSVAWCWGSDVTGELGNSTGATGEDQPMPVIVDVTGPDVPDTFETLDVGVRHTCALDALGRIWCWGEDSFGQLGVDGVCGDVDCTVPVQALMPGDGSEPSTSASSSIPPASCTPTCGGGPLSRGGGLTFAGILVGAMGIVDVGIRVGDRRRRRRRRAG